MEIDRLKKDTFFATYIIILLLYYTDKRSRKRRKSGRPLKVATFILRELRARGNPVNVSPRRVCRGNVANIRKNFPQGRFRFASQSESHLHGDRSLLRRRWPPGDAASSSSSSVATERRKLLARSLSVSSLPCGDSRFFGNFLLPSSTGGDISRQETGRGISSGSTSQSRANHPYLDEILTWALGRSLAVSLLSSEFCPSKNVTSWP